MCEWPGLQYRYRVKGMGIFEVRCWLQRKATCSSISSNNCRSDNCFNCPRLTKLVRGLWNGLRTCVCACVRASGLKINEKCYFSVISWPILILFVLSDRARCGLQNFYTEFGNSLIMQIYANLFKINEKCYFSVISWPILILFVLSDRAWCGLQNFYTEFWNSLIMQIYANLFKINKKCYFSVIFWPILILFVLSDRAWCGLQNFYTEFWNSLIMQIYANLCKFIQNQWKMLLLCHFLADFDSVCFIW